MYICDCCCLAGVQSAAKWRATCNGATQGSDLRGALSIVEANPKSFDTEKSLAVLSIYSSRHHLRQPSSLQQHNLGVMLSAVEWWIKSNTKLSPEVKKKLRTMALRPVDWQIISRLCRCFHFNCRSNAEINRCEWCYFTSCLRSHPHTTNLPQFNGYAGYHWKYSN